MEFFVIQQVYREYCNSLSKWGGKPYTIYVSNIVIPKINNIKKQLLSLKNTRNDVHLKIQDKGVK